MIALSQSSPQHLAREDVYALRRLLVRRLQASSRRVSRRERVGQLRAFADEWRRRSNENDLAEVQRAVSSGERRTHQGRANGISGDFARESDRAQSFLLVLATGGSRVVDSSTESRAASFWVDTPSGVGMRPLPALELQGSRTESRQADLFEIAIQPA